jgi:hypothetical protein
MRNFFLKFLLENWLPFYHFYSLKIYLVFISFDFILSQLKNLLYQHPKIIMLINYNIEIHIDFLLFILEISHYCKEYQ